MNFPAHCLVFVNIRGTTAEKALTSQTEIHQPHSDAESSKGLHLTGIHLAWDKKQISPVTKEMPTVSAGRKDGVVTNESEGQILSQYFFFHSDEY
jgi:hypothetical protein